MTKYLRFVPYLLALAGAASTAFYGADLIAPIRDAICAAPGPLPSAPAPASDAPDGGAQ